MFFFSVISLITAAQPVDIHVFGRVYDNDIKLKQVEIYTYSEGSEYLHFSSGNSNKFDFKLPYGKNYILTFSKAGYISKSIEILAEEAKIEEISDAFRFEAWEVSLFKEIPGMNIEIFDKPLGQITYHKQRGIFRWNAEYVQLAEKELQDWLEAAERMKKEKEQSEKDKKIAIENQEREANKVEKSIDKPEEKIAVSRGVEELEKKAIPKKVERKFSADDMERMRLRLEMAQRRFPQSVEVLERQASNATVQEVRCTYEDINDVVFRKVSHSWGATHYFKNGVSISKYQFDIEILTKEEFKEIFRVK